MDEAGSTAERPFVIMVAGPNGSGKTTLVQQLRDDGRDFGDYINADEIEKTLSERDPRKRSREAQALAEKRRRDALARRSNFTFETVMSHPSKVEFMRTARALGYNTIIYFVATDHADINVRRVDARVRANGHPVPHDRIRTRYERALHLAFSAARSAETTFVFDNSDEDEIGSNRPLPMMAKIHSDGTMVEVERERAAGVPAWVQKALFDPIAEHEAMLVPTGELTATNFTSPQPAEQ